MKFRHEYKHYIDYCDYLVLKQRLDLIMSVDSNTNPNNKYVIRSLYFDNIYDKVLQEKLSGINVREKFRLRYYNNDTSFIRLERKSKINYLSNKESTIISAEEAQAIIDGDTDWITDTNDELLLEFYSKMKRDVLEPKTIVEYTREPYIMDAGNVRVTIDSNIKTSINNTDFLDKNAPMIPIRENSTILEVKYDNFLPEIVKNMVNMGTMRTSAFSKYGESRMYG